jgi:hypothetical protein
VTLTHSRAFRWFAPLAVVAVMLAVIGARASFAGAAPSVSRVSAHQLLAKVTHSHVSALSGVVQTTSDLATVPSTGKVTSMLTSKRTVALSVDGANRQRVEVLDPAAKGLIVHNQRDVLAWSSLTDKIIQTQLPALPSVSTGRVATLVGTPQALAQQLLAAVDKNTALSVGPVVSVAGRSTQVLQMMPKSADSLIKQVNVFVDMATGMAMRTTVLARGSAKPALDVVFSSLKLGSPASSIFDLGGLTGAAGANGNGAANGANGKGANGKGANGKGANGKGANGKGAANGAGKRAKGAAPAANGAADAPGASDAAGAPAANGAPAAPGTNHVASAKGAPQAGNGADGASGANGASDAPGANDAAGAPGTNPLPSLPALPITNLPLGNLLGALPTGSLLGHNMLTGDLTNMLGGLTGALPAGVPGAILAALPTNLVPAGVIPSGALPKGIVPQGIVPQGIVPQGIVPNGAASKGTAPAGALPVDALPAVSSLTNVQSVLGGLTGTGFGAVSEIQGMLPAGTNEQLQALLSGSPSVTGAFGTGRMLVTQLLTVLVTNSGGVFAGAVDPQALLQTVSANGHD